MSCGKCPKKHLLIHSQEEVEASHYSTITNKQTKNWWLILEKDSRGAGNGGLPTSYPSAQESEAGGSQIRGQWELNTERSYLKTKTIKTTKNVEESNSKAQEV